MFASTDQPPSRHWREALGQTLRSFRHRDYRVYSLGQFVSMTGTAMQGMALSWIAYQMTHSAAILGLVTLCTNAPILFFSLFGGMVADGHNRRRLIIATQWIELVQALVLCLLVYFGMLEVWSLLTLCVVLGTCMAFELPARQAFVSELVDREETINAISLNSIIYNATRSIGPTVGAVLLSNSGAALCFGLNAASFVVAIVTLYSLRTVPAADAGTHKPHGASAWEALKLAVFEPQIRSILLLTLCTSFFGLQFTVLLPVFVQEVFEASPHALGLLMAASSIGALASALVLARTNKSDALRRNISRAALVMPVGLLLFALSSNLYFSLAVELLIGVCVTVQLTSSTSALQLAVPDTLRGRVMGLYTMVVLGAMPFGSLLVGWFADYASAPLAVGLCTLPCMLSALAFTLCGKARAQAQVLFARVTVTVTVPVPPNRIFPNLDQTSLGSTPGGMTPSSS